MVIRNIQRIEVIEISFNLPPVLNRIAQRNEDVFDSFPHNRDRMEMPAAWASAGKGDVDGLAFATGKFKMVFEGLLNMLDLAGDLSIVLLNELTKSSSLIRRHAPDHFLAGSQRALFSQMSRS